MKCSESESWVDDGRGMRGRQDSEGTSGANNSTNLITDAGM